MQPQELSEFLNFKYYLVSSSRELEIFAPQAQYLDREIFGEMLDTAKVLYRLVDRIVKQYLVDLSLQQKLILPDFPFKKRILDLPNQLPPYFWVRYDAFERASGGIFFSEFNYDKPCAQREIIVSDYMNPPGNPNRNFSAAFSGGVTKLWQDFGNGAKLPGIGILVDPNHYDESHLAFLYADLLKSKGYRCSILGGHNLRVRAGVCSAFGKPIDILLRQYPSEFSHEINDYDRLLDLIADGRVMVLNDPRSIVPQAKSMFAYLWELLNCSPASLSEPESRAIRQTIPYTRMFDPSDQQQLIAEREKWVLKSVFGRYSETVYIGSMMNDQEWQQTIDYVTRSEQAHVMQEFVPIKRRVVPFFNGFEYENRVAFGNFGIYFTCGEFSGTCVRWSGDYLSHDDTIWFTPVGVTAQGPPPLKIDKWQSSEQERRETWTMIAERAAFEHSYTNNYTGACESFSLDALILPDLIYRELVDASESLAAIFVKTRDLICSNYHLFAPLLGLTENLEHLLVNDRSKCLSFISRLDWTIDRDGHLRLLELNTDTPAGLESYGLNRLMHSMHRNTIDPNSRLPVLVREQFSRMAADSGKDKVNVLGLVAMAAYEEDWANILQLARFLKPEVERVVLGDVSALEYSEPGLKLYGEAVDGLYRYYPLDWWATENRPEHLLKGLTDVFMINPAVALLTQSKAFLAIVWQLLGEGFYSTEEKEIIKRYIVPTFLEWPEMECIIKPYMEREGKGVVFSKNLKKSEIQSLAGENFIYQKMVDIYPVDAAIYTSYDKRYLAAYPILGAFLIGNDFGGIYTRLGDRITDRFAVVAPTFIEE